MNNFNESEIKYLAGLFDTDGCVKADFRKSRNSDKYFLYMVLQITAAESVDRNGQYIKSLAEKCGSITYRPASELIKSPQNIWRVSSRDEINKLVPRLMKHLIVKGNLLNVLYKDYTELQGIGVDENTMIQLKQKYSEARKDARPIKPKNHPTWAWVAGVVDGDGYLCLREGRNSKRLSVAVNMITYDEIALKLLQKAFGGKVYVINNSNVYRWEKNLGVKDRTFAIHFLSKIYNHSRLKKYKIQQMLEYLNSYRRD